MKKNLLFLSASVLTLFTANAQIIITQNDMPTIGNVATEAVDTLFIGITPGNSGSTSWNFSNMANHNQNETGFVNPTTLSASGTFPTANIGAVDATGQQSFLISSATSLELLGAYGDFGLVGMSAIKFNPSEKMLAFPSTYNTTFNDTYTYNVISAFAGYPGIDSIKMDASVASTSLIDGYGSVTTPQFSNVPSLRQKMTNVTTSTSYVKGALTGGTWMANQTEVKTAHTYSWWSNTQNFSLVSIETDSAGATTSAKYLMSMQAGTVGIHAVAQKENSISIYPNPSTSNIHITGVAGNVFFVVSDVTGKLVGNTLLTNFTNSYDVSNYENGIYFYQALDLKGNVIGKGKFVVAK